MNVQVAAGDSRQSVVGEVPSYVDCQTNIMRLTKQVAQIVQEMVSLLCTDCSDCVYICCGNLVIVVSE